MAKNNHGKVVQMLSPENYIRKKARTLPINQCLVNEDWEEHKMAQVLVARRHTTGNMTLCFYLVDLMCLGVKDTYFQFNIPFSDYLELVDDANTQMPRVEISYELAHNIVHAGLEFAEEYGFKPHKDFTSVTRFMLEEDTEDIELIEIECGLNGQPAYMRGPYDDDAKATKIIAQLERTAGPGNYSVLDKFEDGFDDDDDDEFDDDDDDEFFDQEEWDNEGLQEILKTKSPGLQFKIQLLGVDSPPVWRQVIVPSHYTFKFFHDIIQDVFGWENDHLYCFSPKGWGSSPQIMEIDEDNLGKGKTLESSETPLSDIFKKKGQNFIYTYDFGDNWDHQIVLEEILQEEISRPSCIDGKGQCPPEDCGGASGYENLKAILNNPASAEHEDMKGWLGLDDDETWDPGEFNLREVQEMLADFYSLDKETNEA